MAIIHLPNGVGETLGDNIVTTSPLELNGNIWFVHYGTGTDAVSPAGQNKQAPLKTLAQAVSNSSNGDIIVLMDGHEETIAVTVAINKVLMIVGAGSSGGYPTVKFTNNQAAAAMFSITLAASVQLRNLWIEEEAQANSASTIINDCDAGHVLISGCYIQCGQYNDSFAIEVGNSEFFMIKNTTFISTATSVATQPYAAIGVTAAAATMRALMLDNVTVDGGTYGWSNYHAIDLSGNANNLPWITVMENLSLLRGSDVILDSVSLGIINASTHTGSCRIDWSGIT